MDKLASLVNLLIKRWTTSSPKTYQVITNVAIGTGIAATVITLIPFSYPVWVLPTAAFAIALSAKFTVEK